VISSADRRRNATPKRDNAVYSAGPQVKSAAEILRKGERMRSNRLRVLPFAAAVVLTVVPFPRSPRTSSSPVSSQTSPVTAANAKALYAGINVYSITRMLRAAFDGRQVSSSTRTTS